MYLLPDLISPYFLALAIGITLASGFVKGAVGFGMPMIIISGIGSFLAPDVALAALILPTVASNGWQAFRGGIRGALTGLLAHWVFVACLLVFIALSAQLVGQLSASLMFMVLGVPVTFFALTQLLGWRLVLRAEHKIRAEIILGSVAGFIGGLSGVWGPATIAYLTSLNTPKSEQVSVQGVIYGAGSVVLMLSHVKSGVLNAQTVQISLWLILPALFGMAMGFWVQDRLDQERFRKATLLVLIVAGLNLIRRAIMV